jgi:DMSO/TMAO reductase YedYZ molybdopterin-dependent catalytic subunit
MSSDVPGPTRMLVPLFHLWKSAKWARGLQLIEYGEAGLWEALGYHNYGDPWRKQQSRDD